MKREGNPLPDPEAFEGKEEELAQLCISEIRHRRWYFTRNAPGRRQTATAGTPDLIIAGIDFIDGVQTPVTFWIELKKKGGKLSPEQTVTKHVLTALGHRYACVYSYEEFLAVIDS